MKKFRLALISFSVILTSCFGTTSLEYVSYEANVEEKETYHSVVSPYQLPKETNFYNQSLKTTELNSLAQLQSSKNDSLCFEEGEDPYLLVVPLAFSDSDPSTFEQKSILLQNAFFGSPSKNVYESVASYYNRSSYGHIEIKGQVTEWFTSSSHLSAEETLSLSKTSSTLKVSSDLANEIVTWLADSDFDLTNYLTEDGKYIRGLYVVYDYPPNYQDTSSLFWAYVDRADSDETLPAASTYAWSSIDFIGNNAYKSHYVEANTFIHEVGHLFGLQDYYNTDNYSIYQPTGFFDMMDYNLGDHSSFSKYLLNWATPYIVNEPQDITIRSFTETGDFILMPTSSFNNSPYDEYILIEYFTPTGLNDSSSFSSYVYTDGDGKTRIFNYPSYHGLRIYHIDARLVYYSPKNARTPLGFVENLSAESLASYSNLYVGFAHDNSPNSLSKNMLCHLLSAEGESDFINGIAANNSTLFAYDDTFGTQGDEYYDFTFNKNGENLPLSISIDKIGTENITLSFKQRA
jgi:M6 family metalloprotease-like protein